MLSIDDTFRKELGKMNFEVTGRNVIGEIGLHTFRAIVSSWWIDPFVIINVPFWFLANFFALKFTLFDTNIATQPLF